MSPYSVTPPQTPSGLVRAHIARAEVLLRHGHYSEAVSLFDVAVEADSTPAASIALAVAIADIDCERAEAELERARDDACRRQSPWFRAIACWNLALLYQRQGNLHMAARNQQSALGAAMEWMKQTQQADLSVEALIDLAGIWASTDDIEHANRLLSIAVHVAATPAQQAAIASSWGVLSAQAGFLDEALVHMARAHRQYQAAGESEGRAHTLINLGHVLSAQQRYGVARRAFRMAGGVYRVLQRPAAARSADRFADEAAARERIEIGSAARN